MTTKYFLKRANGALPKFLIPITFIIAFAFNSSAQVYYNYDDNGNRLNESLTVFHHSLVHHNNNDTSGKDSANIMANIKIYPNPTASQVNVAISSYLGCEFATLYLSDASGNLLSIQKTTASLSSLKLSNYGGNIFYLKIIMCDTEYSYTLLKASPGNGTPQKSTVPK